jgi:hypothetical protein
VEIKVYIVYCYSIFRAGVAMGTDHINEEIRWHVIKSMLDEFPTLRKKTKNYLENKNVN